MLDEKNIHDRGKQQNDHGLDSGRNAEKSQSGREIVEMEAK